MMTPEPLPPSPPQAPLPPPFSPSRPDVEGPSEEGSGWRKRWRGKGRGKGSVCMSLHVIPHTKLTGRCRHVSTSPPRPPSPPSAFPTWPHSLSCVCVCTARRRVAPLLHLLCPSFDAFIPPPLSWLCVVLPMLFVFCFSLSFPFLWFSFRAPVLHHRWRARRCCALMDAVVREDGWDGGGCSAS